MSVYDDVAKQADEIRKVSRSDSEWEKKQNPMLKFHRVTSEVESQIQNKIISETEVTSSCRILHDLVQVDFRNVATKIRKVSSALTKDVVSLNNNTFQSELEETAKTVESLCNEIIDFETQVKNRLPIVRKIQADYQTIAYYLTGQYINYK